MTSGLPRGYVLKALDEIDSTNEEARRLAAAGAAAGTVVWAKRQTAGRGRRGRSWISEPGNLFTSLILRPHVPPARAAELTFVASLAVAQAVAGFLPGRIICTKWPNDVLVDGGKIAGILIESAAGTSGKVDWLVVGIGINVAHHPNDTEIGRAHV